MRRSLLTSRVGNDIIGKWVKDTFTRDASNRSRSKPTTISIKGCGMRSGTHCGRTWSKMRRNGNGVACGGVSRKTWTCGDGWPSGRSRYPAIGFATSTLRKRKRNLRLCDAVFLAASPRVPPVGRRPSQNNSAWNPPSAPVVVQQRRNPQSNWTCPLCPRPGSITGEVNNER